ncbi:MAG: phosphate ABC transporter permease subunit PstC [Spirochaetales bacterium]|jgi:phosphate transport system permease protein
MNDKRYFGILTGAAILFVALFAGLILTLVANSAATLGSAGLGFISGLEWNPVTLKFGAWPFIMGTLLTSFIALAISLPFSLATGMLLGEYVRSSFVAKTANIFINLLASIPSVVYGLWGLTAIVPLVQKIETAAGVPAYGVGILSSSLVLAIMIIPFMSSMTREVLKNVPDTLRHGAFALGATRREMMLGVSLPYVKSGIAAGVLLALGRALGETMAVTMLIGNATRLPTSLFSIGNTLASVIASQFNEAESDVHRSAMMELALILLIITFVINLAGRKIIEKSSGGPNGR